MTDKEKRIQSRMAYLKRNGVKQVEIARELGVSRQYIHNLIFEWLFCVSAQAKIAEIVDVPYNEFWP